MFPRAEFQNANIDNLQWVGEKFDYIFALSVWDYVDQKHFVDLLHSYSEPGTVLFFEMHKVDPPHTNVDQEWFAHGIMEQIGVKDIKLLGRVDFGQRPIYRAVFP